PDIQSHPAKWGFAPASEIPDGPFLIRRTSFEIHNTLDFGDFSYANPSTTTTTFEDYNSSGHCFRVCRFPVGRDDRRAGEGIAHVAEFRQRAAEDREHR